MMRQRAAATKPLCESCFRDYALWSIYPALPDSYLPPASGYNRGWLAGFVAGLVCATVLLLAVTLLLLDMTLFWSR